MTDLYQLSNRNGVCLGVFSDPQKAMDFVYLSMVYQIYRGYTRELNKIIWRHSGAFTYYGYLEQEGIKPPMQRGLAIYEIHPVEIDWLGPVSDKIAQYAKETELPTQEGLFTIIGYLDERLI